jgi:hypothetical protein
MIPRVVEAEYQRDYIIHIRFSDGVEGEVDLGQELYGELFESLKDVSLFKQFSVHSEFRTLCWPNGADIAPEFLYKKTKITA